MAKGHEVLSMLIPDGGWVQNGDTYEGIDFVECDPITKQEYLDGFAKYDAFISEKEQQAKNAKNALYLKLNITADEARLLLS